jgi:hypothetical protein
MYLATSRHLRFSWIEYYVRAKVRAANATSLALLILSSFHMEEMANRFQLSEAVQCYDASLGALCVCTLTRNSKSKQIQRFFALFQSL